MSEKKSKSGISILFGITFLSPVLYSVVVYEMDVVQKMFFFSVSLLLFAIYVARYKSEEAVPLNKFLAILMITFPFTFLTAFINSSGSLFILRLSDIIVPSTILMQSALLFVILGEEKFFKVVSYSVVIVSTLFSVLGILEVFQIQLIPLPTFIPPGSTLGHRSFAAEYLLPSIPFLLIMNEYVKKDGKIFLFLAGIANVSFLLFTRNRSGIIILILVTAVYLVYIFFKKKKEVRIKILIPVISVIMVSILISLIPVKGSQRPDIESTAETLFSSEFKSNILRMNFWDASLKMVKENPVAGIGLYKWSGYYPKYFGDYFTDDNVTYVHNIHAHNDFLEIFAESGAAAFIVFLLIYLSIALYLLKKIKHNEKYFFLLLTFLITTGYSLVAFPNHKFASYFLAAVAAGTAVVNLHQDGQNVLNVRFLYLKLFLIIMIIIGGSTSYVRLKSELSYGESMYLKGVKQYDQMKMKLDDASEILYPFDASKQPIDYYRGIANYYLRDFKEALDNTLSARNLAPFNPIVLNNVAASYENLGGTDSTIAILERMKLLFPNYIKPQINLLSLYYENGRTAEAELLFAELNKKSPDNSLLFQLMNRYKNK